MFKALAGFFGQIIYIIYDIIRFEYCKYGISLIIFTIIVRTLMLPLVVKQIKSQEKMNEVQPLINDIQRKYKNDREKLSQEMMKIYQQYNYNPLSGCLPLFIQMPIIISLFAVIRNPLTYMLKGKEIAGYVINQSTIENLINKIPEGELIRGYEQVSAALKFNLIDFNFLGINLGMVPTINRGLLFGSEMSTYLPLLIIPILACVTTYISSKMMSVRNAATKKDKNNKKGKRDEKDEALESMQSNMLLIAPMMTLIFSFQFPAGLGFYWTVSNIYQIVQEIVIRKYIRKKKEG